MGETHVYKLRPEMVVRLEQGKCDRCGECCRWFYIPLRDSDLADEEFIQALALKGLRLHARGGEGLVAVNSPCRLLTEDGKCSVHWSKPDWCREYYCSEDPIMQQIKMEKEFKKGVKE